MPSGTILKIVQKKSYLLKKKKTHPSFPDLFLADYFSDGADGQAPADKCFSTGSIVVKAGCTFFIYDGSNYDGTSREHVGPIVIPSEPTLNTDHHCGDCLVSA